MLIFKKRKGASQDLHVICVLSFPYANEKGVLQGLKQLCDCNIVLIYRFEKACVPNVNIDLIKQI